MFSAIVKLPTSSVKVVPSSPAVVSTVQPSGRVINSFFFLLKDSSYNFHILCGYCRDRLSEDTLTSRRWIQKLYRPASLQGGEPEINSFIIKEKGSQQSFCVA